VTELAKTDPIVRDFVKDEMRLRKKLREIEAIEAQAQAGRNLEAGQLAKLSKRSSVLDDLRTIREQIEVAVAAVRPRVSPRTASVGADLGGAATAAAAPRRRPKTKASASAAPKVMPVNPLPQRGQAPMPVDPQLAAALQDDSRSASRLAAFAPVPAVVRRPESGYPSPAPALRVQDDSDAAGAQRGASLADFCGPRPGEAPGTTKRPVAPKASPAVAVSRQAVAVSQPPVLAAEAAALRPPPPPIPAAMQRSEEAGPAFTEVRRGAKAKKGGEPTGVSTKAAAGRQVPVPQKPANSPWDPRVQAAVGVPHPPAHTTAATAPDEDSGDDDVFW